MLNTNGKCHHLTALRKLKRMTSCVGTLINVLANGDQPKPMTIFSIHLALLMKICECFIHMGIYDTLLNIIFNVNSTSIILAAKWSIVQSSNGISLFDKCKMGCGTKLISLYSTHTLYWLQFYLKRLMINVSHIIHFHIYCWLEFIFYVICGNLMHIFPNHHNNRNTISILN